MSTTTIEQVAPLILSGEGYSLGIAPEAEEAKAKLLEAAASITEVRDHAGSSVAQVTLKTLASMRRDVEKARKTIKEPVLQVGREIDAKAKEFMTEIDAEEARLKGLIAGHAAEVEKARQEAERKRREEEAARLKAEAEAKAAEEAARKAKEQEEEAFWKEDEAQAAKAKEEAEKADATAKALMEEALAAKANETQAELASTAAGPKGVTWVPDFEVEDVHALYAYNREFVEVTPKRAVILAKIKAYMETHDGQLPTCPGLKITRTAKVSTR